MPSASRSALGRLRALAVGAAFFGTVFVAGPLWMVHLNAAWGWPRLVNPVVSAVGGVLVLAALAVMLYCAGLFQRVGQGTPVPIDPPTRLVAVGLYRWSRNPIYVADVAFLVGLFLHRGEPTLLLYAAVLAVLLHAAVVWREEPELRERFGEEYVRYTARVPRWLGARGGG